MARSFNFTAVNGRGPRFWLQATVITLAVANAVALFLYVAPPGGTRKELVEQSEQIRHQILATRAGAKRLRNVADKVQTGSKEAGNFENKYFLGKRDAYDAVISEIQRMAAASGVQEREGVFSEEPIEGSDDLSVLNVTANFQGTYDNLMRFLYEADRSPLLLMLDTLQAAPQQHSPQINTSIRFQAVVREGATGGIAGGQP
jgi:hypothetical protein